MTVLREVKLESQTINADGEKAVRVVITEAAPGDAPGPTELFLAGDTNAVAQSVEEGLPANTLVGNLTVNQGTAPIVFTITQDLSNAFQIVSGELQTSRSLDFSTEPSLNVSIRATDNNAKFVDSTFTINVTEAGGFQNAQSYEFNGDGYIIVNDNSYAGDAITTWWTWLNNTQLLNDDQDLFNSKNGGANLSGVRLSMLSLNDTEDILLFASRSNGNDKQYRYDLPAGYTQTPWHLWGFVVSNNNLELWIDGQLQTPSVIVQDQNIANLDPTGTQTYIGANANGTTNYLTGLMDEIGYSKIRFTSTEWALLWNNGVAPDLDVAFPGGDVRNWYRADGDTLPVITDNRNTLDAASLNVTKSSNTPRAFQNIYSVQGDGISNFFLGSAVMDLTQAKSFSFWLKRTSLTGTQILFGSGPGTASNNEWRIYFDNNANNRIYWDIENGGDLRARWNLGSGAINNWSHVVITMPASNTDVNNVECYLNGVSLTRTNQANSLGAVPAVSNNLALGAGTTGANKYIGFYNQISVWDRELSALEVQEIYNLGTPNDLKTISFYSDIYQWWQTGNRNERSAVMTDTENGDVMAMINYDINFYSGDVP